MTTPPSLQSLTSKFILHSLKTGILTSSQLHSLPHDRLTDLLECLTKRHKKYSLLIHDGVWLRREVYPAKIYKTFIASSKQDAYDQLATDIESVIKMLKTNFVISDVCLYYEIIDDWIPAELVTNEQVDQVKSHLKTGQDVRKLLDHISSQGGSLIFAMIRESGYMWKFIKEYNDGGIIQLGPS